MTTQTLNAPTFASIPPISANAGRQENPLKSVLITVFTLKIVVAAFLIATVSLAPPVNADTRYMTVASN